MYHTTIYCAVVYKVRPIGDKVMTFHLDILDGGGLPARVTFSTLYAVPHRAATATTTAAATGAASATTSATAAGTKRGVTNRGPTLSGSLHGNVASATTASASTLVPWKSGGTGGVAAGGGSARGSSDAAALARRGGAVRCPLSFDTSRSRGWTVVAVDMASLMREGRGGGGGKGYGVLKGVRLGSNMVVRGVYVSDCVYSPHTLPKEMMFRPRGGADWEETYSWLWLPEVKVKIESKQASAVGASAEARSNRSMCKLFCWVFALHASLGDLCSGAVAIGPLSSNRRVVGA